MSERERPIAAYLRVSSKMQAEARSVSSQRHEIERWLEYKGLPSDSVCWYEDEGHTGRDMARPAFKAMTEAIEAGHHDTVIAWDISRISRGFTSEPILWLETIQRLGVRLVLLQMGVDTNTAWGMFFLRFQWILACLYSDLVSEGWQRVMARRKESRLPVGGRLRWGDNSDRDQAIIRMVLKDPTIKLTEIQANLQKQFGRAPHVSTISRVIKSARENGLLVAGAGK